MKDNEVTIIGIAHNGKGGSLLLTEANDVYYMDGIDFRDEIIFGKKIKVTGILVLETFKEEDLKNENGAWKQGVKGEKKTIQISDWEIVENNK